MPRRQKVAEKRRPDEEHCRPLTQMGTVQAAQGAIFFGQGKYRNEGIHASKAWRGTNTLG